MRLKCYKSQKITVLVTISLLSILVVSLSYPFLSDDNFSTLHETKVGEINITSLNMTDEEIIWQGYTVAFSPNESVFFQGVKPTDEQFVDIGSWKYNANRYGLRGNMSDNEQDYRIIILGGSNTYGQGVNYSQIYSYKLEQKLNKESNHKIEVINAGTPNSGIMDYYLFITTLGNKLEPDLVIVSDIDDGMNVPRAQRYEIDREIWGKIDEKEIENAHVIQNNISRNIEVEYFRQEELSKNRRVTEYLEKIDKQAEDNNFKFILSCGMHERCMQIEQWTEEKGINFTARPDKFQNNSIDKYQLPDNHLNIEGHSVYAEHLHQSIREDMPK